jgi:hypothetical protein
MAAVAFGATLAASFVQKKFFVTPPAWEMYLVGKPPFAHLSWPIVAHRLAVLGERGGFVWAPFLVTAAIAALRRDARYLLGWVVAIPWFLLNFTAKQELKSEFQLYTGFPFVGSAFWVAAYARVSAEKVAAKPPPLRYVLWPLAATSLASLAGLHFAYRGLLGSVVPDMFVRGDVDGPALRGYARTLSENPRAYGRLLVDTSIAAWTAETVPQASLINEGTAAGVVLADYDGVTFFDNGLQAGVVQNLLVKGRYAACGRLPRTRVMFCARAGAALPPGFEPTAGVMDSLVLTNVARREGHELSIPVTPRPEIAFFGPFAELDAGRYEAVFRVRVGTCAPDSAVPMAVEVYAQGRLLAHRLVTDGARELVLPFEVAGRDPLRGIELRGWAGGCAYVVEGVDLRAE